MKNFLAFIAVAILATSFAFAQSGAPGTGTGTVTVNVVYQDISVTNQTGNLTYTMMPGQTEYNETMQFLATGAPGIGITNTTGAWTNTVVPGNPGISILNGGFTTAPTAFDGSGNATYVYGFDVLCNVGTTTGGGPYNLGFSFTVSYN